MIRYKDISIPNPCSVDYDSLPGDDIKRFCSSCEKHVYDFTGKDEVYLNAIIKSQGKVCGIYYEDQIRASTLQTLRPSYYTFLTNIVSIGLLLKTFFSGTDAHAGPIQPQQISQQSANTMDTTGIKVAFKNRPYNYCNYDLDVFINGHLYKSDIDVIDGFMYLPDTIKSNDHITVIVKRTKVKMLLSKKILVFKSRYKKYNFEYKNTDSITIEVNYKKSFTIKRKRRLAGVPDGFW